MHKLKLGKYSDQLRYFDWEQDDCFSGYTQEDEGKVLVVVQAYIDKLFP